MSVGDATGDLELETSGGSIEVGRVGGRLNVETAGGSILIGETGGSITADTAGGGILVELIDVGKGRDMHCYLETSGGDVRVILPAAMGATIDAEVRIEGWSRAKYDIYSDFDLDIQNDEGRWVSGQGQINGGGHLIKLSASNGDIYIEKR